MMMILLMVKNEKFYQFLIIDIAYQALELPSSRLSTP